jgi:hypothetical protein
MRSLENQYYANLQIPPSDRGRDAHPGRFSLNPPPYTTALRRSIAGA